MKTNVSSLRFLNFDLHSESRVCTLGLGRAKVDSVKAVSSDCLGGKRERISAEFSISEADLDRRLAIGEDEVGNVDEASLLSILVVSIVSGLALDPLHFLSLFGRMDLVRSHDGGNTIREPKVNILIRALNLRVLHGQELLEDDLDMLTLLVDDTALLNLGLDGVSFNIRFSHLDCHGESGTLALFLLELEVDSVDTGGGEFNGLERVIDITPNVAAGKQ